MWRKVELDVLDEEEINMLEVFECCYLWAVVKASFLKSFYVTEILPYLHAVGLLLLAKLPKTQISCPRLNE